MTDTYVDALWHGTAALPASCRRFEDGASYRFEIPSVEGPRCAERVLESAVRWQVPVVRMSQGSGTSLLTDGEIRDMGQLAREAGVEMCLFIRPCAAWDASATARASSGAGFAATIWGAAQLNAAVDELYRAAELGIRSVLIADAGLLVTFGRMRAAGQLPADMIAKTSVMLPTTNAATAGLFAELGAGTINVAPDLPVIDLAAIRASVAVPLDVYIEAPDDVGGFVRYHELSEVVRVAAPVYVKLGLRNAPSIYPSGTHLDGTAVALGEERVRRARIAFDTLRRAGLGEACSRPGAAGLAIPVTAS